MQVARFVLSGRAFTVLVFTVLACTSSKHEDDPPHPAYYALGICNHLARCSPNTVRNMFGSTEACAAAYTPEATRLLALLGVTIERQALNACVLEVQGSDCAIDVESIPQCDFKGALVLGAACTSGIQCTSGSCSGTPGTCGVCVPRGATCGPAMACEPGRSCVEGTCVLPSAAPENACTCSGQRCDADGTCQPYVAEGGACQAGAECVFPLDCIANVCARASTCGQ